MVLFLIIVQSLYDLYGGLTDQTWPHKVPKMNEKEFFFKF